MKKKKNIEKSLSFYYADTHTHKHSQTKILNEKYKLIDVMVNMIKIYT